MAHAKVAAVFPGQGSQKTGMAQDFYDEYPAARAAFDEASQALGEDLAALCFQPDPRLDRTEFTQPALLAAEIAMYRVLAGEMGLKPACFAGHSLGEYAALVAAGVIPLAEAARLVSERGRRMQRAVPEGQGAMTALTALGEEAIDPTIVAIRVADLAVDIANRNSPGQLVLSGAVADVAAAESRLGDLGRLTRLNVSAPFHSRLMHPIEPGFREVLVASAPRWDLAGAHRVLSNFTGTFYPVLAGDPEPLIHGLTRQISSTVRWVENMQAISDLPRARVVEIGPKRTLRAFFRALGMEADSVTNLLTARRLTSESP